MSKIKYFLTILLICIFSLSASRPILFEEEPELFFNLPPLSLMDKVSVVLSPETSPRYSSKPVWALIPRISLIHRDNISDLFAYEGPETIYVKTDFNNSAMIENKDDGFSWMDESLITLAKDIAEPISVYMFDDNISADDYEYRRYLYTDLSAILFSHFIRGITNNQLDLYLITSHNDNKSLYVNGMELGFRPDPLVGFRVKVWEDNETTTSNYGFELHVYPVDYMFFKIAHEDNKTDQRTGIEVNIKF